MLAYREPLISRLNHAVLLKTTITQIKLHYAVLLRASNIQSILDSAMLLKATNTRNTLHHAGLLTPINIQDVRSAWQRLGCYYTNIAASTM